MARALASGVGRSSVHLWARSDDARREVSRKREGSGLAPRTGAARRRPRLLAPSEDVVPEPADVGPRVSVLSVGAPIHRQGLPEQDLVLRLHAQGDRARRQEDDGRVDGLEVEGDDAVGALRRADDGVHLVAFVAVLRGSELPLRSLPRVSVVGVERGTRAERSVRRVGGSARSFTSKRRAMVGSSRRTPTSPRSTCSEKPTMRPAWGWLSSSSERPTRGKRMKSAVVKSRMGTESRQVAARKPRPTTRRLRRMRGTSTGRPVLVAGGPGDSCPRLRAAND